MDAEIGIGSIMQEQIRDVMANHDVWLFCQRCNALDKNGPWMSWGDLDTGKPVCSICWGSGKVVIVPKGEPLPKEIMVMFKGGKK
jgi:hypothetical protein